MTLKNLCALLLTGAYATLACGAESNSTTMLTVTLANGMRVVNNYNDPPPACGA